MSDQDLLQETHRLLGVVHDRIATRIGGLAGPGWDALPSETVLEQLVARPHFTDQPAMLEWGPRQIVGHLRDSARLTTERLIRLRSGGRPRFDAFDPLADERLEEYESVSVEDLVSQLERAQQDLRDVIGGIEPDELDHVGEFADGGQVSLRELLERVVEHEEDHAEQLEALTADSMA